MPDISNTHIPAGMIQSVSVPVDNTDTTIQQNQQVAASDTLASGEEDEVPSGNPNSAQSLAKRAEKLDKGKGTTASSQTEGHEGEQTVGGVEEKGDSSSEDSGQEFQQGQQDTSKRFPHNDPKILGKLNASLPKNPTVNDVLKLINDSHANKFLGSQALKFLLETATDPLVKATIEKATRQYVGVNAEAIRKGAIDVSKISLKSVGEAVDLNHLFTDLAHDNTQQLEALFELIERYPGQDSKVILKDLLSKGGAETKYRGSDIEHGRLANAIRLIKDVQAMLSQLSYFTKCTPTVNRQIAKLQKNSTEGAIIKNQVTDLAMAAGFLKIIRTPSPTPDQIIGVGKNILGLTQIGRK